MKEYIQNNEFTKTVITVGLSALVAALVSIPMALFLAQSNSSANTRTTTASVIPASAVGTDPTVCGGNGATGNGATGSVVTTAGVLGGEGAGAQPFTFGSTSLTSSTPGSSTTTNTSSNNTGNFGNHGFVNVPVNVSGNPIASNDLNNASVLNNNSVSALNGNLSGNSVAVPTNVLSGNTTSVLLKNPNTVVNAVGDIL